MNEHERRQVLEAQRELEEKRKNHKPVKLPAPMRMVEGQPNQAEIAYFQAIGVLDKPDGIVEPVYPEAHVLTGQREKWDAFNSDRHPKLQAAIKTIGDWYDNRIADGGGIILAGGYGSGKSHLAQAIRELYGYGALYWNETRLVELVQAGYSGGGRTEQSIFSDVRRAKLLVYDDLGAYQTTNADWIQRLYYNLFDGRKEAGLATMITTNLPLMVMEKTQQGRPTVVSQPFESRVGGRVFSRLMGQIEEMRYYVDMFGVPDYRKRKFDNTAGNGRHV